MDAAPMINLSGLSRSLRGFNNRPPAAQAGLTVLRPLDTTNSGGEIGQRWRIITSSLVATIMSRANGEMRDLAMGVTTGLMDWFLKCEPQWDGHGNPIIQDNDIISEGIVTLDTTIPLGYYVRPTNSRIFRIDQVKVVLNAPWQAMLVTGQAGGRS